MMWFKREPKSVDKSDNGVVGKLRKKKAATLKPTRESSERETSTESEKERRRYSDILDMKASLERRDESDESLYESADGHSDAISASDDALPRLSKTPATSKESLKIAVTDEEVDLTKTKKGHRKTMSLSNPLEIVKNLGDEWFDTTKKELEKCSEKKKSRESLRSEDSESIHGSNINLDQIKKHEDKSHFSFFLNMNSHPAGSTSSSSKSSTDAPKVRKISKGSSVSALNFLRRKKTPTSSMKSVESVAEDDKVDNSDDILKHTKFFLEEERRHASICNMRPPVETDSDEIPHTPKPIGEHRRRLSRQTSRSKSKVRGKSQNVKVNTLRKSHSGTLKKGKKKSTKAPAITRSRQSSLVEPTPLPKKKHSDSIKQNSWFSSSRESRREGSTEEPSAPDADADVADQAAKEQPDKDNNWRAASGRGVNRAESCRERDAPRRGKHRNASDPNRLTAHNNHDLEPGAATAPSGSSSSSSLSSRSNESNTVPAEQQASQSDWSEEEEPLAAQWADSLPPHVLDSLLLSARLRKRQEVIHELIVSEGSHVRWLKVLGGVFLRPLETQTSLLPVEELRALFPNLPGVRERHAKLYADLRAVRNDAPNHIVGIRPVADAMLSTLGESGYSSCLSRFCRGQRMALEALRERRRKNKELHQFLASREQLPLCGRLQLRDLLACVWQRLTKYQLLLESILKTVSDSDCDSEEDVARLKRALDTAKDVLHSVDTAIRTAENEHRLKSIQSKLEVRVPSSGGAEWDELRRLDLTSHQLRMEGDLSIRNDTNKKIPVLALMLEDSLVLLQREGDKFLLKPFTQPSQQGLLSPTIKWDKVLFRPNAAVRNTFFLMNINGVQMHELSANTAAEYATWVKYIQESPLANLKELKPILPTSHQHSRSADDSGINVSRNPSDASEKSNSIPPPEELDRSESERDRVSLDRSETEREDKEEKRSVERESVREDRRSVDKENELTDREEKHKPRRPTVGRISTHGNEPCAVLEPSAALTVHEPAAVTLAHNAQTVYTQQERLRRLDRQIGRALVAKSRVVAELLAVPYHSFAHLADLAVEDTLGQVDMNRSSSEDDAPDVHQLLLAAHAQATQLTEALNRALSVNEAACVAARARRRARCDSCREKSNSGPHAEGISPLPPTLLSTDPTSTPAEANTTLEPSHPPHPTPVTPATQLHTAVSHDLSYDMLSDLDDDDGEPNAEEMLESDGAAATLAGSLLSVSCGLQSTVARLLCAVPALHAELRARRVDTATLRDAGDALRAKHAHPTDHAPALDHLTEHQIQEQPSNGG